MGIINAKLRILDKVDNTSDKDKNVAMSTKLQTYNTDKSETYGTNYPLYCYWTGSYYDITVDNYKTRVDLAKSAESVPLVNVNGLQTALDGKAEKLHNHDYIPLSGSANLTGYLFPAEHNQVMLGNPSKAFSMICGTDYRLMNSDNTTSRMQLTVSSVGKFKNNQPMISFWFVPDDGGLKQGNLSIGNLTTSGINWSLPNKSGDLVTDTTITDWNKATTSGFYNSPSGATNAPVSNVGITGNVSATGNMIVQLVYPESNDDTELISYTRKGIKNNYSITWTKWIKDTTLLYTYIIKGHNGAENLFNQLIPSTVTSIYFTDIKMPSNATLIDVDDDGDGGVVAWLDTSDNTKMYVSTQYAGIKVEGNSNSSRMFYGGYNLTSLDVSNWDTSNVTNMSYMFRNCTSLTSLDISNFDTSNVTDMSYMFYDCTNLTSLDLSNFDTSNVTDMAYMFYYCSNLTSIDVSNFDTSKVAYMNSMFSGCGKLTVLDVSNFDTSNVTNMSSMFRYCSNLTSLDVSNFDTSKVTNMNSMFRNCTSLTSLDISNFDTSKVTNMSNMFYDCTGLTTIMVGETFKWITTLSGLELSGTWKDETGTTYSSSSTFPSNVAHTYTKVS